MAIIHGYHPEGGLASYLYNQEKKNLCSNWWEGVKAKLNLATLTDLRHKHLHVKKQKKSHSIADLYNSNYYNLKTCKITK